MATELINKIDIEEYNNSKTYQKYDLIKTSVNNVYHYFVSKEDENLGNFTAGQSTSNQFWLGFHDDAFDFANIWTPSYNSAMNSSPRVNDIQYGEGVVQRDEDGINTSNFNFELNFQDISYKEAKSIIAFIEFKRSIIPFKYTLPFPYEKTLKFVCSEYRISKEQYNRNNIDLTLNQFYDIP